MWYERRYYLQSDFTEHTVPLQAGMTVSVHSVKSIVNNNYAANKRKEGTGVYKRVTSYIYGYDNGEKQGSCGYFRLDVREKHCKLSVNIKVPDKYTMGVAEVYLIKGKGGDISGVPLGKTMGVNGSICYKHIWSEDSSDKSGDYAENIRLNDITGILIYNGRDLKRAFAGTLSEKDSDIDILSFSKEYEENTVYEIDEDCQREQCMRCVQEEQDDEELQENEELRDNDNVKLQSSAEMQKNAELRDSAEMQKNAEPRDGDETQDNAEPQNNAHDMATADIRSADISWQELLFTKFPKVRINFGGEDSEAVKMRPHDLVWFPRKYWRFSNNQYLLNGYYNYRYIMLVRGMGEREGSYYLAVPGSCGKGMGSGSGDMLSAVRHGFTEFVTNSDDFGYWCCKVGR